MIKPTKFNFVCIDADSLVYAAGHACQKQLWRVWPAGALADPEENPPSHEFSNKTKLNQWLKSVGSDPKTMKVTKAADDTVSRIDDDNWQCVCDRYMESEAACLHTVKAMLTSIIEATGSEQWGLYLTAGGGFRAKLYPEYKMNRDPAGKPIYYDLIRTYMIDHWDATVFDDLEADDAVAIDMVDMQRKFGHESCILASIDKDLQQIAGWHYNYQKELELGAEPVYYIDEAAARRWFFMQLLMGDSSDNIPGIPRVGEKTAEKMLASCKSSLDYLKVVEQAYADENAKRTKNEEPPLNMEINASLLFMRRTSKDDNWRDYIL